GWQNPKSQGMLFSQLEDHPLKEQGICSVLAGYIPTPPKLEDFFAGGDSTETREDSSLTHNAGVGYFAAEDRNHDLKNLAGIPAFSANSGSEVDNNSSTLLARTQSPVESGSEFPAAHSQCPPNKDKKLRPDVETTAPVAAGNCKKISDTFGQRTSIYRGVTRHRWTGRYEAHLWDNSCRREGQARKGRQVYLGGYDKEDKAARAYDLAALKYWGPTATTNFPASNYAKELEEMKGVTRQEFIASLRRKSSGFSRGASIYRGVTRHHQQGRWQARIGRVAGNKDLYLGTFATEEEAAEAYDIAAIKFRGVNAVTNFEMNRYDVEAIAKSPLPIGGTTKRLKLSPEADGKKQSQCSGIDGISFSQPLEAVAPYYHHHHHHLLHHCFSLDPSMAMMPSSQEFFFWPH
ncbi:hypothetical protein M569_06780, partial [Genlisea aurea]